MSRMAYLPLTLRREVIRRARRRCEYCLLHADRATIRLLQLNQIDRLLLRQELYALGRYP
jgi:hypothetical protein